MALQYASAAAPRPPSRQPGRPGHRPGPDANGCNGVLPTPGSENTLKRLVGGDLTPGGTAEYQIALPVNAGGCRWQLRDHRLRLHRRRGHAQVLRPFVPNNQAFILDLTLNIPAGTPIGAEFCNYAKTTASPSPRRQATARPAQPASSSAATSRSSRRTRPVTRLPARISTSSARSPRRTRSFPTRSSTASATLGVGRDDHPDVVTTPPAG